MVASSARASTKQRTQYQSGRKDAPSLKERTPQLTHTDPPRPTFRAEWMGWYVAAVLYRTVSYEVNVVLLQHAPNLLNILHIHASNTNVALELTVTVLNDFELKRDTVQPKNDFPPQ